MRGNQDVYCSVECYNEADRIRARERKSSAVQISQTLDITGFADFEG